MFGNDDLCDIYIYIVTDVELRRLFGQLNTLTENAVTALGGPLNKMPATSTGDGEGTDQRLILKRIAQLLDPCKSEEDRFTVCSIIYKYFFFLSIFPSFFLLFVFVFVIEICCYFGNLNFKR